ncbi:hypothetical protein [Endozoicomonas ascidiicola]|uniref:hypothetical protein n=1 Tax=Endozoicomonas ascidiicola TaxID=1698521 RepID=UPI000829B8A5|nr:hypothetical protein [Endozoicomonas ascidiicola]
MNNKISPVWMFFGFFMITLLWALEFDNRPRSRLAKSYHPGLVKPQVFEELAQPVSSGYQKKSQKASVSQTTINAEAKNKPAEPKHRDGLLSESTKRLISIANRHLPAHEQIPYMPENGAISSSNKSHSMYGSEDLFTCFTDQCLNAMSDY